MKTLISRRIWVSTFLSQVVQKTARNFLLRRSQTDLIHREEKKCKTKTTHKSRKQSNSSTCNQLSFSQREYCLTKNYITKAESQNTNAMDLKRLNPGMTAVTASGGGVLIYNLLSEYSPYILLFLKRSTCYARVMTFYYLR